MLNSTPDVFSLSPLRSRDIPNTSLASALEEARQACEACGALQEWDHFVLCMRAYLYGTEDQPDGHHIRLAKHGEDGFVRFPKQVERCTSFKNIIKFLEDLKVKIKDAHPENLSAQCAYAKKLLVRFQLNNEIPNPTAGVRGRKGVLKIPAEALIRVLAAKSTTLYCTLLNNGRTSWKHCGRRDGLVCWKKLSRQLRRASIGFHMRGISTTDCPQARPCMSSMFGCLTKLSTGSSLERDRKSTLPEHLRCFPPHRQPTQSKLETK